MAELRCGATGCTYNKDMYCCKGDILVGGKNAKEQDETCCESFLPKREDSYTIAIEHACKTISIDCEAANCIYNANYKCQAEHVDIKGSHACVRGETCCATFKDAGK